MKDVTLHGLARSVAWACGMSIDDTDRMLGCSRDGHRPLSPEARERCELVEKIRVLSETVCGGIDPGYDWLSAPQPALAAARPIDVMASGHAGLRQVHAHLLALMDGKDAHERR